MLLDFTKVTKIQKVLWKHNIGSFLQLSTLMAEDTTQTCAMSSYSYVLFKKVSVSLKPEMLYWEKDTGLKISFIDYYKRNRDITYDYELINPQILKLLKSAYLQPLYWRQQGQGKAERGTWMQLSKLSSWNATPVDGIGIAHFQNQIHSPFTAKGIRKTNKSRSFHKGVTMMFLLLLPVYLCSGCSLGD